MKRNKILRSYRFEKALLRQIRKTATENGWTDTHVIMIALQEYFEQHEKKS